MDDPRTLYRDRPFLVERNYDGWRLDRYLTEKIGRLSRSKVRRLIGIGRVRIEREGVVKPGSTLRAGDRVVLRQPLDEQPPQFDAVQVLQHTPDFVALNKPAGMLVHPTARAYHNTLLRYGEVSGLGLLNVVHRLDRETSGVVVMARERVAARRLSAKFSRGDVRKIYRTVVVDGDGQHTPGARGVTTTPLGFDTSSRLPKLRVGVGAWEALTRWQCVGRNGDLAELEVEIEGGRQHQIRAHLALLGTPVVGDKLYLHGDAFFVAWTEGDADATQLRAPRHALHASQLELEDDGRHWVLVAPRPALFDDLMNA